MGVFVVVMYRGEADPGVGKLRDSGVIVQLLHALEVFPEDIKEE
jgi:hypothetical protein